MVDASPIILLGRIDYISLLTDLIDELIIPAAVADEIAAGPTDDPARLWIQSQGIIGNVEHLLNRQVRSGGRVSEDLISEVSKLAGEI